MIDTEIITQSSLSVIRSFLKPLISRLVTLHPNLVNDALAPSPSLHVLAPTCTDSSFFLPWEFIPSSMFPCSFGTTCTYLVQSWNNMQDRVCLTALRAMMELSKLLIKSLTHNTGDNNYSTWLAIMKWAMKQMNGLTTLTYLQYLTSIDYWMPITFNSPKPLHPISAELAVSEPNPVTASSH